MESPLKFMAMSSDQDADILACTHDRLSGLPDQVMYHIFSFLGANDTARLGLVSKRFKKVCSSSPYLNFVADFDSGSDQSCLRTRYTDFCSYVDKVLRSREKTGEGLVRLLVHWFCKQRKFDIGGTVVNSWVTIATKCGVEELDMLVHVDPLRGYSLPDCVYKCESLRALKLNLQMGRFSFQILGFDWLKDLWLVSVTIGDKYFGQRISDWCKCLKRLTLENVDGINDFTLTNSSLEELEISGCRFPSSFSGGKFSISGSSFKVLTISRCQFKALWHVNLNCLSLENLTVQDSEFGRVFVCKIDCESLETLEVCGSNFLEACQLLVDCPSLIYAMISSCRFANVCFLNIKSFSLQGLTLSECKFSSLEIGSQYSKPKKEIKVGTGPCRRIIMKAENLETLNVSSSDAYSYEFPLSISAPKLKDLWWTGDPIDFSYLNQGMVSLLNARIHIKPTCQHRSEESDRRCKHSKSLIYCAAKLLQCLSEARFLSINTWPIEIFFMQNVSPIVFKKLQNLVLLTDGSFSDQIPIIASFLKGLPNLRRLIIKCDQISHELSDPNLIDLLGLNSRSYNLTGIGQDLKNVKIEAVQGQAQWRVQNAGKRR
ncbi:hypothetical protein DKX38_010583 [Salix brachista]|uniref:F-box domain-containing protein n=1 Tax=Salix brachista TaxID=2182728 RepID=A0A5N5ME48_9ROSI|nr:hypothetical protein DKX38_010583 [Salix brachista]